MTCCICGGSPTLTKVGKREFCKRHAEEGRVAAAKENSEALSWKDTDHHRKNIDARKGDRHQNIFGGQLHNVLE